jgi:single-strand DNA-binding protein
MPSLNHACLLGTLPRTPTVHQTAQGTPVCTFDLQVDAMDRDGPCVIRVVVWGRHAEASAQHLGRNSVVCVAGPLRQSGRGTMEGVTRRTLEAVAEGMKFLSPLVRL